MSRLKREVPDVMATVRLERHLSDTTALTCQRLVTIEKKIDTHMGFKPLIFFKMMNFTKIVDTDKES